MERYWDALRSAGWIPDSVRADVWKQWSCGANILPSLAEWWGQAEPNRRPAHRQEQLREWLLRYCARDSQLTLGWPSTSSVVTPRFFWWPDGMPSGRRVGVLSSHLGQRLDHRPDWFHALRRVCSCLDPLGDQLVTCESTTTDRYLRHCGRRFDLRVTALLRTRDRQSLRAWLWGLVLETPVETGATRERCVRLSPRLAGREPPSADAVPESDWLVGCWVDELYLLYLRPRGRLFRMVVRLLHESDRPMRIHLALGEGLVPPNVAKPLLSLGAVGWYLPAAAGDQWTPDPRFDARVTRRGVKTENRKGEAPAEPAFVASLARQEPRPPSFETASEDVPAPASIVTPPADESWTYLVHWTRRQSGRWPDQDEEAYLNELLFDFCRADRSALAALIRIVTMQRILATGRLIRGGFDVVCFSQRCLDEWAQHRTFRSHQHRWDFELYGLCIDRQWLVDRNTRPVIYGDDVTWERMSAEERPFFQRRETQPSPRRKPIRWSDEKEWRHPGDLDLRRLPASLGLVFVPTDDAARKIAQISRWPVTILDRGTRKD